MATPSFEPIVTGHNSCYMAQAWFPRAALEAMLPEHLTIPANDTMASYYPDTEFQPDDHPFMLSFSHGSDIHDVYTNMNVPEQEEIMFVFPVTYTAGDGTTRLSSYVPALYLDSFLGMVGGLYFGLRKEYHPGMQHGEGAANARWWQVEGILEASFETRAGEDMDRLPHFFAQTFANPFVTVSYPLPFSRMVFYQARVHPEKVCAASESFYWNYRGETVKNSDPGCAVFAEYSFSMSRPMKGSKYFG